MKTHSQKPFYISNVIVAIMVVAFMIISLFPFFWILITSFKPSSEIFGTTAFQVISKDPTWENYFVVIFDKNIIKSVFNSLIVAGSTTIYVVIIASLSAYIIARFTFTGKSLLMGIVLSVSMFPQMIVVGPIFNMFYKLGILNSYFLALAYSTITFPTAVWIMVAHFKSVPLSIEEAARIDGCSPWQTLWKIVFPVASSGVATTAIMTFIAAWNEYLLAITLNVNKEYQTVPVAINALRTQYSVFWGQITAATVLVVIPTIIIVLLFQKKIVGGISNGAVKE